MNLRQSISTVAKVAGTTAAVTWLVTSSVPASIGTVVPSMGLALFTVTAPLLALLLYVAPTLIALHKDHPSANRIAACNLVVGWTGMGWLVALGWSLTSSREQAAITRTAEA